MQALPSAKSASTNVTVNFKYEYVITGLPQANVEEGQEFVGWYYDDKLVANGDKISELVKDLDNVPTDISFLKKLKIHHLSEKLAFFE